MNRYADALSEHLRRLEAANQHENKGYWYPSQIGQCDRKNILQHIGAEAIPYDDRTLRLFWLGNQIHKALQETFPFEVVGHELGFKDETLKVSGRLDTLARVDGVLEAVEFKSVNSKKFNYRLPDEKNELQLHCYLSFPLTSIGDQQLIEPMYPQRGRLVYWSKDDAEVREFIIEPDIGKEQEVRAEFERMEAIYQRYLTTGELPPEIPEGDWRRNYCNYKGTGRCCADKAPVHVQRSVVRNEPPADVRVPTLPLRLLPGGGDEHA